MEVSIFPRPNVRAEKSKFVEARLHADTKDSVLRARIAELVDSVAKTTAQPTYVALNPTSELEIGRFNGSSLKGEAPYVQFLSDMAVKL